MLQPRSSAISIASLFALGMLLLLYFIWTDRPGWALFWWLFVATVPVFAISVFYGEVLAIYERRIYDHRAVTLWAIAALVLAVGSCVTR